MQNYRTIDGIENLFDMSLRLKESTPNFETIQKILGIARRLKSRREQRSNDGPIYYMIVRRKPQELFVFKIVYAKNLDFHLLT